MRGHTDLEREESEHRQKRENSLKEMLIPRRSRKVCLKMTRKSSWSKPLLEVAGPEKPLLKLLPYIPAGDGRREPELSLSQRILEEGGLVHTIMQIKIAFRAGAATCFLPLSFGLLIFLYET